MPRSPEPSSPASARRGRSRTARARPTSLPATDTPWDWSHHTTYELRLRRLRHRFSYAFVRELYDLTMDGMLARVDGERQAADLVEGVDARRGQWQAPMARTFAALRALRWYAVALCRVYGVPSYKGSGQWAGGAYRRFIAADTTELPQ